MRTSLDDLPRAFESPPTGFDPAVVTPPPLPERQGRILALALDVSGRCNMACRYCAEAATLPPRREMSPEIVDAAWRFLFADGKAHSGVSLRFGSGEPLLGLAALRHVANRIDSARQAGEKDRPAAFLTTNGLLVSDKVIDWLIASDWNVKISLDGPPLIHDTWRVTKKGKATYARIAPAVVRLAREIPERFSVTAVFCHGTDPQMVFDAIAELGVRRIELVPVAHRDDSVALQADDWERYESFVSTYAERYVSSRHGQEPAILVRFAGLVTRVMGYNNLRVPCGAGRSFLGVSPEGALYPCFRFIGVESFLLGNLDSGLNQEAVDAFLHSAGRGYEKRMPCRRCWAAPLCGGPCFACAEFFGPGEGQPVRSHCMLTLADARAAVWLVRQLRRRDPERLLSFLPYRGVVE